MNEELNLSALYARYRNWKSVVEPAATKDTNESEESIPIGTLIVQFEATGKEDVRLGFSPHGSNQWLYEIALGFSGNTEVVVRKYVVSSRKEIELKRVFTGRTLSNEHFVPYWVVLQQTTMVAGIGKQVGMDPIVNCTLPLPDGSDTDTGMHQIAFTTWNQPARVRELKHEYITSEYMELDRMIPRLVIRGDPFGEEDLLTLEQRNAYEQECAVIIKRSQRFGGDTTLPDIKTFIDPKVVRRLQRMGAASERGFTTGINMLSAEEMDKRANRAKRFDTPQFGIEYSTESARAISEGMTQEEWSAKQAEKAKLQARAMKFGGDPDISLGLKTTGINLVPASDRIRIARTDIRIDTMVETRDDAIHIYCLDEDFEQVKTTDMMEYFMEYGPWYVEWLNNTSCTVVFEDSHTAGRALISMSEEIPEGLTIDGDVEMAEVEEETNGNITNNTDSFRRSQWRYGVPVTCATSTSKSWRLLLRLATADDFPPDKPGRKYHERSIRSHGGRERGGGRRDRRESRRHDNTPYSRDGERRRKRRRPSKQEDEEDSDTTTPSSRLRMNDDGSIEFVRNPEPVHEV